MKESPLLETHSLETQIRCFADSPWPVLITGETGVGKERVARALHDLSPRKRAPFVPINCGSLPSALFESELFGHEKGAFSGALQSSRGLIRQARGGSLFLDEIGDLDRHLQVKLLRFLESKEIRSVGSSQIETVDLRLIAATNVNLSEAVASGAFRQDLWERLSVLDLAIPPLRERKHEIPKLYEQICEEIEVSGEAGCEEILGAYDWPGNIRQFKNVLIRASVLGGQAITQRSLRYVLREEEKRHQSTPASAPPLTGTLADIERNAIVSRLKQCRGNRKKAAKELGIAKSTLHEKLRRWKEESQTPLDWPLERVPLGRAAPLSRPASRAHALDV